jgi:methyl-accepting chemotaxis protein
MEQIAGACGQQSDGIIEITAAARQMSRVTGDNASNSAECAHVCEELSGHASNMQALVSRFTLSRASRLRGSRPTTDRPAATPD